MHWHQKNIEEVIEELGSSLQGISAANAQKLLLEHGPNELTEKKKKDPVHDVP